MTLEELLKIISPDIKLSINDIEKESQEQGNCYTITHGLDKQPFRLSYNEELKAIEIDIK